MSWRRCAINEVNNWALSIAFTHWLLAQLQFNGLSLFLVRIREFMIQWTWKGNCMSAQLKHFYQVTCAWLNIFCGVWVWSELWTTASVPFSSFFSTFWKRFFGFDRSVFGFSLYGFLWVGLVFGYFG